MLNINFNFTDAHIQIDRQQNLYMMVVVIFSAVIF